MEYSTVAGAAQDVEWPNEKMAWLAHQCKSHPHQTIQYRTSAGREEKSFLTFYEDVYAACCRFTVLIHEGATSIAILAPPSYSWIVADLAAACCGLTTYALAEGWPPETSQSVLDEHGIDILLTVKANAERIQARRNFYFDAEPQGAGCFERVEKSETPTAIKALNSYYTVVFTSGTQSRAKSLHVHFPIDLQGEKSTSPTRTGARTRVFIWMSFSHYVQRSLVLRALASGYALVLSNSNYALTDLAESRANYMVCAPEFYSTLAWLIEQRAEKRGGLGRRVLDLYRQTGLNRKDPGHWARSLFEALFMRDIRSVYGGRADYFMWNGSSIKRTILETLDKYGIQVCGTYGISEIGSISWDTRQTYKLGSVGIPQRAVRLSEDGQLLVKADATVRDSRYLKIDEQGYIHTGDVCHYEGAHLYIDGRTDDIAVLSNGKNVRIFDLEAELCVYAGILDAYIWTKDGRRLSAIVVKAHAVKDEQVVSMLRTFNRRRPAHERIFEVTPVDDSLYDKPIWTTSRKIIRSRVIELFVAREPLYCGAHAQRVET